MIKPENQSSNLSEFKIEKILGHKITSEFNVESKSYYDTKLYKIKWLGFPVPTWELESNLQKYKGLLKNYKKLYENNVKENYLSGKQYRTSLYSECNMRLDTSIISEDENNINILKNKNDFDNLENGINKNNKTNKRNKKRINKNTINNSKEKLSKIFEVDEDKESSEEEKNKIKKKKKLTKKKNDDNLYNDFSNASDYLSYGPNFYEVLNACSSKKKENAKEDILLNKKRKNSNSSDSFTISIEGMNPENKIFQNSDNLNKIIRIIVPSEENNNISLTYKNNDKEIYLIGLNESNSKPISNDELLDCYEKIIKSNINKISKEELINNYEQIIKKYLAGETFNFD